MQKTRTGRPRSERRHNAILLTAIDLVLELGFRAVSIEFIAAKTGVAKQPFTVVGQTRLR